MASRRTIAILFAILTASPTLPAAPFVAQKQPDCTGNDRWPASMAFVHLKNAGLTNNELLDFSKTKTMRLASERTAKDTYRQVHHVTFVEKSGRKIEAITVNEASAKECSASGVSVYVIDRRLGD